jgi:hypothetical protein
MLALDDGALARICISATRLPRSHRRRWLKEVADARLPTREAAMAAFAKSWRRE